MAGWIGLVVRKGPKTLKKSLEKVVPDETVGDFISRLMPEGYFIVSINGHSVDPDKTGSSGGIEVDIDLPLHIASTRFQLQYLHVQVDDHANQETCTSTSTTSSSTHSRTILEVMMSTGRQYTCLPSERFVVSVV